MADDPNMPWNILTPYMGGPQSPTPQGSQAMQVAANTRPAVGSLATDTVPDFENPGAVFDDEDEAARDVLNQINPASINQNMEYGWLMYTDKNTGKIGYTTPQAIGPEGDPNNPATLSGPRGGTIIGMGHTHGGVNA